MCPPQRHALLHDKNNTNDDNIAVECQTGTKYIVVDVGGGTVDITCHQIQNKEGSLKELHKSMGGPNGSIGVDLNFEK
ncbi:unnamed protein product, partial [Oppiella nova]